LGLPHSGKKLSVSQKEMACDVLEFGKGGHNIQKFEALVIAERLVLWYNRSSK